jgi:hypothetical protein
MPLLVAGYFWHRSPESMRMWWTAIQTAPKAMMTSSDMGAVRTVLAMEYVTNDRYPSDLEGFLADSIDGVHNPHLDRWETPYRIEGPGQDAVLLSAGPDEEFETDDDLATRIFAKKKTGDGEGGSDASNTEKLLKLLD